MGVCLWGWFFGVVCMVGSLCVEFLRGICVGNFYAGKLCVDIVVRVYGESFW